MTLIENVMKAPLPHRFSLHVLKNFAHTCVQAYVKKNFIAKIFNLSQDSNSEQNSE